MPPMIQGEPPKDFEDDREFMEGERYPPCIVNPKKYHQERGTTPVNMIVRLSLLRKTILIPEYEAFMRVCVFVDGCISQF